MPTVLAISSQVARGSVGLSVITPALQALGHTVIALPTVVLSNHPGHAHTAGGRIDAEQLVRIGDALAANGWLGEIDTILSGYLPSAAHVAFVATTVERVRTANPACRYVCDPVLGDDPKGLYIDAAAAAAIRERLLPLADIAMPNRFELAWLAAAPVTTAAEAVRAARSLAARQVIATSIPSPRGTLLTLAVDSATAAMCEVPRRAAVPNGTGDLLSALSAGGWSLGRAVAAVDAVIDASTGHDELQVTTIPRALTTAQPLAETAVAHA